MESIDMLCRKCNTEVQENVKFCSQCGESIVTNEQRKHKIKVVTIAMIVILISIVVAAFILHMPKVVLVKSAMSTVSAIEKEIDHTLQTLPVVSYFEDISKDSYLVELKRGKQSTTLYTDLGNQNWRVDNYLGSVCGTKKLLTIENNLASTTIGIEAKDLKGVLAESSLAREILGDNINVDTRIWEEKDREKVSKKIKTIFLQESIQALKQVEVTKEETSEVTLGKKVVDAKTYRVIMQKDVLETMLINIGNRVLDDSYIRSQLSQYEILQSIVVGEQGLGSSEERWKDFIQQILNNQDLDWNFKIYRGKIVEIESVHTRMHLNSVKNPLQSFQVWNKDKLTFEIQSSIENKVYHLEVRKPNIEYGITYRYKETQDNLEVHTKNKESMYSIDTSEGNQLVISNSNNSRFQLQSSKGPLPENCFEQDNQYTDILKMDFYNDTLTYLLEMLYNLVI